MKTRKPISLQFTICVDNSEYTASLELHNLYRTLPNKDAAEDGALRIIDKSGEDYLYLVEYFVVIEAPRQTAQALAKSFTRNDRNAA
ncbi:MAG: hypothetical protein AB7P69_23330 [Candidatus Binatia bacterium]